LARRSPRGAWRGRPLATNRGVPPVIEQAAVIERILHHLDLPAEIPAPRPARAPPPSAWDVDLAWPGDETPMYDPCF
jgi:hypothetical protein